MLDMSLVMKLHSSFVRVSHITVIDSFSCRTNKYNHMKRTFGLQYSGIMFQGVQKAYLTPKDLTLLDVRVVGFKCTDTAHTYFMVSDVHNRINIFLQGLYYYVRYNNLKEELWTFSKFEGSREM